MTDKIDDIDVLVDDEPVIAAPDDVVIVDEPKKTREISRDEGIEALRRQLEAAKQEKLEAERRATAATDEAHRSRVDLHDSNLALVNTAIDTVRQNSAQLKAQYSQALSIGDYDTAADLQEAMAASATTLQQLQLGAESLREQKVPPPRPVITDKVEALASSMTPKSAEWLRRNPECATDERLKQKMIAAHHLVVADGFEIESPAYFREVERVIGLNKEHDYDPTTDAAQVTQRRTPAPAAPVSRGSDGRGSASKTVTLSAAEREIASDMGMTEREYAKNKYQLQREGKLSK